MGSSQEMCVECKEEGVERKRASMRPTQAAVLGAKREVSLQGRVEPSSRTQTLS